jgi:hypothetical protein
MISCCFVTQPRGAHHLLIRHYTSQPRQPGIHCKTNGELSLNLLSDTSAYGWQYRAILAHVFGPQQACNMPRHHLYHCIVLLHAEACTPTSALPPRGAAHTEETKEGQ